MVTYTYYGMTNAGREKKGTIEAETKQKAQDMLQDRGMYVISLDEATFMEQDVAALMKAKAKPRDYSVFCRQFVSMIRAGVTIVDALEMLGESTKNKKLADAIQKTALGMRKGEGFAEALGKHEIFPETMVQMVSAGENSGNIEESFERLSIQYEKSAKLNAMVKKASVYPIIVGIVAFVVLIIMLVKVIPAFTDMFAQMGTELPFITKAVVAASDFVINNWLILLIIAIVIIGGIKYYSTTRSGKYFFAKLAVRLPIFGNLNIRSACSTFARTTSTLLVSGMPIIRALEIVEDVIKNQLYKDVIRQARSDVSRGLPMSRVLMSSEIFPAMVCHMVRIGEETGDLDGMMARLADYCDEEVEMATQSVMAAVEPMIILVLAVFVVILIAAIFSPMLALYSSLENL